MSLKIGTLRQIRPQQQNNDDSLYEANAMPYQQRIALDERFRITAARAIVWVEVLQKLTNRLITHLSIGMQRSYQRLLARGWDIVLSERLCWHDQSLLRVH